MNNSKQRVINIAKKILYAKIDLIEGAREMAEFDDFFAEHSLITVPYEDYEVFMEIENETYNLPLTAESRKNWAPSALKLKDQEIKEIEDKYRLIVEEACKKIINKLESCTK